MELIYALSNSNFTCSYSESKYVTLLDYKYTIIPTFVLLLIQILMPITLQCYCLYLEIFDQFFK